MVIQREIKIPLNPLLRGTLELPFEGGRGDYDSGKTFGHATSQTAGGITSCTIRALLLGQPGLCCKRAYGYLLAGAKIRTGAVCHLIFGGVAGQRPEPGVDRGPDGARGPGHLQLRLSACDDAGGTGYRLFFRHLSRPGPPPRPPTSGGACCSAWRSCRFFPDWALAWEPSPTAAPSCTRGCCCFPCSASAPPCPPPPSTPSWWTGSRSRTGAAP